MEFSTFCISAEDYCIADWKHLILDAVKVDDHCDVADYLFLWRTPGN